MRYLVIFHTFSGVMYLEKEIKKRKWPYETMPAPRKLSTDCGVAIVFETEGIDEFISSINTENIQRIYLYESDTLIFENY